VCLGSENKRPKEPLPRAQKPSASLLPGFYSPIPFQSISFQFLSFPSYSMQSFTNGAPDTWCAAARKVHLEAALVVVPKVDVVRAIPDGCPWRPKVALVALGLLRPPVPARVVGNLSHQVHVPQRLPLQGHLRIMIMVSGTFRIPIWQPPGSRVSPISNIYATRHSQFTAGGPAPANACSPHAASYLL
jgi:hypothetical protein